jgi:GNAT superfamily N-acetyltransferase
MSYELRHADYLISDDPDRLDVDAVHAYLSKESYWAQGVSREVVEASLQHSLCVGIYTATGAQVGLVRVVTDYATFAWVCDVYVLEAHRKQGLSKAAITAVLEHPRLQTLRRFTLATRDAHGLYAQFGFTPIAKPESHMEKRAAAKSPPGSPTD